MRRRTDTRQRLLALTLASLMAAVYAPRAQQPAPQSESPALRPTNHPRLPADVSQLWLVPANGQNRARTRSAAMIQLADAVKLEVDANYA